MYQTVLHRFIWMVVLVAVVYSAPARDRSASKISAESQQPIKEINEDKPPITRPPSDENTEEKPHLPVTDNSEDNEKSEEASDNKEVVDYQAIQKDSNSKVVNDKQIGNEVFDQQEAPALSDAEAGQLMMLLRDPVAIAEYLAVSGDIVGFLEVLDALQINGFINGKIAEQLKNEVSGELDRLLIEQDSEENEVYPMQSQNEVYMENEMLNIIKQIMTLPVLTPGEVYQAMLYEGASELVASVAGLVYQRIIEREITPEAGVSLVAAVFQLSLPNEYIPEETTDESYYDDAFLDYILETMSEDDNVINDVIEDESQQAGDRIEHLPIMNSAGKQIGEEQKVHGSNALINNVGKVIGKEVHDEVQLETENGGSLEEELQDMVMEEGKPETNDKSSSETESVEGYGSGASEIEYIIDDKDLEQLPDILKMRLKNYFKAVDDASAKLPK